MIEVTSLVKDFGARRVLDGISFEVASGEIFGCLGPNGVGKTTIIRLLHGLILPTRGALRVLSYDPVTDGASIRAKTGVLTENDSLYETLTARANLHFIGSLYNLPTQRIRQRAEELLEWFGLRDQADERVAAFSKGMRQRLAIARALLHDPELIFLDEPTANLDPVGARQVMELVADLSRRRRRTVLLATHRLAEAQRYCTRVMVLHQGRILLLDTPQALIHAHAPQPEITIRLMSPSAASSFEMLRNLPEVKTLEASNQELRLTLTHEAAVPTIISLLAAAGERLYSVIPTEITLEDVYCAVCAPATADQAASKERSEHEAGSH